MYYWVFADTVERVAEIDYFLCNEVRWVTQQEVRRIAARRRMNILKLRSTLCKSQVWEKAVSSDYCWNTKW